ncbi:hydrid cluster protein-associated redox disulfide domain protein [Bosea sp. 124]|uniref:hydrid cluster protein-associated redox disulfide domain protein n=1 Tax=Bosea sp. 124 TaxID=2135642 RepID=UPI000D438435|nr:hydrid cluster protein-associated redox disulfide domain protein [Bosea sp. 124]PTM42106.1 hybrid cluster-associated redox disulfide protein [Bosea sp. 124]
MESHRVLRRPVSLSLRAHKQIVAIPVVARHAIPIRVFLNGKLWCVGCPIACFHMVEDACREHGVSTVAVLATLRAVAAAAQREPC